MDHLLTCQCGEVVVKSINGMTKIRNKVMVFRGGQGYAVCKGCGAELLVLSSGRLVDGPPHPTRLFVESTKRDR